MSDQSSQPALSSRYALIFRTHFWDDFAQRQLERLLSRTTRGDVYVLLDETHRKAGEIAHNKVIRMTEADVLAMGYPRAGSGNMLWFNGDYPLYLFAQQKSDYAYYLTAEYDVVMNTDIDAFVKRIEEDKVDFVGLTKGEPIEDWAWRDTCRDVYTARELRYQLICMSVYSRRAVQHLATRRLELAKQYERGDIKQWPFCEGFIATEMTTGPFVTAELSKYLDTASYDTWPPFLENRLPDMADTPIIHPVLDPGRYVDSLVKYNVGLAGYFNLNSTFHRKLRCLSPASYISALANTFVYKAARNLRAGRIVSK